MSYSGSQLATRVLRDLGLVAAEETPSAADLAWAEETCSAELDLLTAKGIPIWNGATSEFPPAYLTVLSRRIGLALAPSFGITDIATAQVAMRAAEADLRALGSIEGTGEVARTEYF